MGYQTNLYGQFLFSRRLTKKEREELDEIHEKDWRDDETRPEESSYYCQWVSDKVGLYLEWDECEKFYGYIEWLEWLIKNFFDPKNIKLNGTVKWKGEERGDIGKIVVTDNIVKIIEAKLVEKVKKVKVWSLKY